MSDAPLGWLAVAAAALGIGRGFTWLVGRLTGSPVRPGAARGIEAVWVVALVALWWWEIHAGGQTGAGAAAATGALVPRYVGHVVLAVLLAAAAAIDLRHRVIPDAITVPGTLLGLAWAAFVPGSLPPVMRAVPRSFAGPLLEPDVLGLAGPLQAAAPAWIAGWPGLVAALGAFAAWWAACTAPFLWDDHEPPRPRGGWREPRGWILAAGLAGVAAAWSAGGGHRLAVVSSLAGIVAGGGIVWLTRAGASRALGREAMGFGDVTLMAMVGAWLGWQPAVLVCCLAVPIGLLHGLLLLVLADDDELPFGPALCLGAAVVVVAWRPLWERAAAAFDRPLELVAVVVGVVVLTAVSLGVRRRLRGPSAGDAGGS